MAGTVAAAALAVLMVFGGWSRISAAEAQRPGYLSPPELYKVAEDSENTYTILTADESVDVDVAEFADLFWPSAGDTPRYPWIEAENGSRNLSSYELGESCLEALSDAEPFFKDKQYEKALTLYLKAVQESPDCYVAYLGVGDGHYFQEQFEQALPWYDKAIALNPYDFIGHFYRANTLLRLRRYDEARETYVQALAIRPHRESVLKVAKARQEDLGVQVVDEPFQPKAFARKEGDGIAIYVSPESPAYWLTYGLCKAIWIGEPSHREERTGRQEHVWSLTEERQCLKSMLESYYALREDGTIDSDPFAERLLSLFERELVDGFVLYEIAYRLYPHAMLLLPEEMFSDVVEYVNAEVLVGDHAGEGSPD